MFFTLLKGKFRIFKQLMLFQPTGVSIHPNGLVQLLRYAKLHFGDNALGDRECVT